MNDLSLHARLRAWVQRYLLAEIVSTGCALFAAALVYLVTRQALLTALANTVAESVLFYAVVLVRDMRGESAYQAPQVIRRLVLEFGPAEALDTLLLRPALLYLGMAYLPNPELGILLGKLGADLCFYAPAIASYELLRRSHKRGPVAAQSS